MSASGIRTAFLYPFPQGALRKLAQEKGYGSSDIAAHWCMPVGRPLRRADR